VLDEALATSVASSSLCDVITRQDIASMIGFEAERQACGGETSDSCLAEIGSALGVERIVAGSVARLGGAITVSARLMNLKAGKVERRAERTVTDAAQLRDATRAVGAELFGVVAATPASASSSGVVWAGAIAAGTGLAAAIGGGVLAVVADTQLAAPATSRAEKDGALTYGVGGLVVVAAGVVVGVVGGVVAVAGAQP
jgi:TolB-like protein